MTSEDRAAHSPNLDTVLMVEAVIREHSGEYKKRALWENLPKKMMYQTFSTIIRYLQDSGMIATDSDKKICWIYNQELINRYLSNNNLKDMSGKIKSPSPKLLRDAMKGKIVETSIRKSVQARSRVSGVYESLPPVPATGDREIQTMLTDIISRLNRIEEKIDENVYPPESAIRPEFIRQVKKAEADIRKRKGKSYESMGAFIRAISE